MAGVENKAVGDLTPEEAAAELKRLAGAIAGHDARYYQDDAPTFPTPNTTRCASAMRRSRRIPGAETGRQLRARVGGAAGGFAEGAPSRADAVARQRLHDEDVSRLRRPRPPLPEAAEDEPIA